MSKNSYKVCLLFPNGEAPQSTGLIDLTYSECEFRIGEKLIIEGEAQAFRINDVQHQFKRKTLCGNDTGLVMIMTNVILDEWSPNE